MAIGSFCHDIRWKVHWLCKRMAISRGRSTAVSIVKNQWQQLVLWIVSKWENIGREGNNSPLKRRLWWRRILKRWNRFWHEPVRGRLNLQGWGIISSDSRKMAPAWESTPRMSSLWEKKKKKLTGKSWVSGRWHDSYNNIYCNLRIL